jgi:hypothetical protein
LRWHLIPVSPRVLFASRFRREGRPLYQYSPLADNVLLVDIRNHTVNVISTAIVGKVSAFHNDSRRSQRRRHHWHTQHTLPQAFNTQNGTVGEIVLYKDTATSAIDASAKRLAEGVGGEQN